MLQRSFSIAILTRHSALMPLPPTLRHVAAFTIRLLPLCFSRHDYALFTRDVYAIAGDTRYCRHADAATSARARHALPALYAEIEFIAAAICDYAYAQRRFDAADAHAAADALEYRHTQNWQ